MIQNRVIEIPLIEPAWYRCPGQDERPYRLTDGHPYTTDNVVRRLRDHKRRNGFKSWGFCSEKQARRMGRRIRPSQRGNCAQVWFQEHCGNRPAEFYNEDQLD